MVTGTRIRAEDVTTYFGLAAAILWLPVQQGVEFNLTVLQGAQQPEYGRPRHRTVPGVSFPAMPTQARAVIANYGISKDARARTREQPSGLLQQPALRRQ